MHGIPFKGFPSLHRQMQQIVLVVRSILVVKLFSFSYNQSNFLLSMFVKGKSRHPLWSQISSPGLFSCMFFYFFFTYFSTGFMNTFITLITAHTINVIINVFVTFKTWIVCAIDTIKEKFSFLVALKLRFC